MRHFCALIMHPSLLDCIKCLRRSKKKSKIHKSQRNHILVFSKQLHIFARSEKNDAMWTSSFNAQTLFFLPFSFTKTKRKSWKKYDFQNYNGLCHIEMFIKFIATIWAWKTLHHISKHSALPLCACTSLVYERVSHCRRWNSILTYKRLSAISLDVLYSADLIKFFVISLFSHDDREWASSSCCNSYACTNLKRRIRKPTQKYAKHNKTKLLDKPET